MRGFFLVSWMAFSALSGVLVTAKLLGATAASWERVTAGWWAPLLGVLCFALPVLGFKLGEALGDWLVGRSAHEAADRGGEG